MYQHALLPIEAYQASVSACGWNDFIADCSKDFTHPSLACLAATSKALNYLPEVWDPYNVLAPTCHNNMKRTHKEDGTLEGDDFVVKNTPFLGYIRQKYNLTTM